MTSFLIAVVVLAVSEILTVEGLAIIRPTNSNNNNNNSSSNNNGRRAFVKSSVIAIAGGSSIVSGIVSPFPANAEQAKETRQGNEVTAFNGLAFNYKGGDFGGLDASSLDEPTVSYKEFNERMQAGEVVFVEFMAPDGDIAYATFKDATKGGEATITGSNKKIRIGEGYPIEQHDGYSSPMFCIRAVKNAGVPYKFTVKGMEKYSQ